MQVLEYHHQRLVEALAQEDALDASERAPLADLRVHLRERVVTLDDPEQPKRYGSVSSSERSSVETLPVTFSRRCALIVLDW